MRVGISFKRALITISVAFFVLCLVSLTGHTRNNIDEYIRTPVNIDIQDIEIADTSKRNEENKKPSNIKYILQWTSSRNVPFEDMGKGHQGFIDRKCAYTNCYVTDDRYFLGDYKKFDVIAFNGPQMMRIPLNLLPAERSPHQKYVFGTIESADNYPICHERFNGLFNWTWTYKLDSEVQWGYVVVRDIAGKKIGPKKEMHWMKLEDMDPVTDSIKVQLKTKSKAAAWLVSNCYARNKRDTIAKQLKLELSKYNLTLDVYGKCGNMKCATFEECWKLIENDYYFYLSFENSFAEDYVTEKLLHGLEHNAVPIVYGGANYTRFMPDGIYLNAKEMTVENLAKRMNQLILNREQYYEYFKWKNHYYYHGTTKSVETNEYCRFCELLNNDEEVKKITVYDNFRQYWNPPGRC